MDLTKLATDVTVFITPFLPYLVLSGEAAAKEMGKRFGGMAWEKAQALWNKIQDPSLDSVSTALAENTSDSDFQIALAKLLAKRLETYPELALELMNMMKEDDAVQTILVEHDSKVKNIYQRLTQDGKQEVIIRSSQAGDITQER